MRKLYFILVTVIVMTLGFTGCKSSKTVTGTDDKAVGAAAVLRDVAASYEQWNTYTASGKLILSGKASLSSSIQLKMLKDKNISISIRPVLGIELAKVFINNDSAVVINKFNKVYTSVGLDVFSHVVPMNVGALQDIFLSRIFSLNDGTLSLDNIKKFEAESSGEGFDVEPRKKQKDFSYVFSLNKDRELQKLSIYPSKSDKSYVAEYGGHSGGLASVLRMETDINGEQVSLEFDMNTSRAKWNATVDEELNISKSYKKVTLQEFVEVLKSIK